MDSTVNNRKRNAFQNILKLVLASILIGFLSTFLALVLKRITEHYEEMLFLQTNNHTFLWFAFPLIGLSTIYLLRQYLFKKKENKGIREIFESTQTKSKNLPLYKIPSHFINGFLTVIFGGSTGIEVSTVVASATIGSVAQQKDLIFRKYKTELISAGVAAGITALFCSPLAGILFAMEVIARKTTRIFFLTTLTAIAVSSGLLWILNEKPLFAINITTWHYYAIPYFIILGILSGIHSVYLTRCVLYFKKLFSRMGTHYHRILIGTVVLSVTLWWLPVLYGDGYHAITGILFSAKTFPLTLAYSLTLIAILFLKPVATAITLASGGDGGVFAPSLFMGAFLGFFTALVLNTFFDAQVIPVNFIIIGMAAVLSASIHAPFTALFLVCGIVNDYTLFFPILGICLISKYTAKTLYPFTVYTFIPKNVKS